MVTEKKRKRKSTGGRRISFGCVEYTTFVKNEPMTPSKEKERHYSNIEVSPDTAAKEASKAQEEPSRRFSFGTEKKHVEEKPSNQKNDPIEVKEDGPVEEDTSAFSEFCSSSLLPHQSDDDSIIERPSILSSWASQAKANPTLWDGSERKTSLADGKILFFYTEYRYILFNLVSAFSFR